MRNIDNVELLMRQRLTSESLLPNEIQMQNSTNELPVDERLKKTNARNESPKENVRVLLEVEVTESLYAAISRDEGDSPLERGEIVEVTIIRPEKRDPFMKPTEEHFKKSGKFRREKLSERSIAGATERRDIPRLDKRKNKSFAAEDILPKLLAMKVGDIVGDLPSVLTLKPRIISPEIIASRTTGKISHGDHCDPVPFNPKISHTKISNENDAANFLRPYVESFNKYDEKMNGIQPCVNPLVYQLHLQKEDQRKCPLVEVSAAQKILESYATDKFSCCNENRKNFDLIRKTLMEWGSDEQRIGKMLRNDSSTLMKCEHCGVISSKKKEILKALDNKEVKKNVEKWKGNISNIDTLKSCDRSLKIKSKENLKGFDNLPDVQNREGQIALTELIFGGSVNTDEITSTLTTDIVAAERESDSVSENRKSSEVGQKKVLKSSLPLYMTNRYRQSSSMHEKNERFNDTRFKSTRSTRYSPRQTPAKFADKLIRNTCEDNRNGDNFDTGNKNNGKHQSRSPPSPIKPSKVVNTAIPVQDLVETKTSLLKDSSRKINNYAKSLMTSSNIPVKLEKNSFNTREEASPITEKKSIVQSDDKRSFVPFESNENDFRPEHHLRIPLSKNQRMLAGGMLAKGSQDQIKQFNNIRKNIPHSQGTSFGEKLSTDQEYGSISSNDQGSLNRSENREPNQIGVSVISDYNYSAPLIGSPRQTSVNRDFVTTEHYLPEINSPAQFTGESETTAFSSSSSENAIREWARCFAKDSTFDSNDDRSSFDAVRNSKVLIDGAIDKSIRGIADCEEKFCSRETVTIRKPETRIFDEWSRSTLKMTYKNPSTVISSSSEYSGEDNREVEILEHSLSDKKIGNVSQFKKSEKFDHRVEYDENSAKEISETSKTNLEAKALPVYRKILESKDKMDWETFQQLVGTLHPGQRELWCDICKAVSNEAKRVSGETGASTEVCIEINPVPTSQTFTCERISVVNSSENEVSFEMDMTLNDFKTYSDKELFTDTETSDEFKKF